MRISIFWRLIPCSLLLIKCTTGTGEDIPRLEIDSASPIHIKVGETTGVLTATYISADNLGKETSVKFEAFVVFSADPTIATVVEGKRLAGIKSGNTVIQAFKTSDSTFLSANAPEVVVAP